MLINSSGIRRAIVVGGPEMISSFVVTQFFGFLPEKTPSTSIEQAIFTHLGLTPDRVGINEQDWVFADHSLSSWSFERIMASKEKPPILVGEFCSDLLNNNQERVSGQVQTHKNMIKELILAGTTVVNTDADIMMLQTDGSEHADDVANLTMGLLAVAGLGFFHSLQKANPQEKKKILSQGGVGLAAGLGFTLFAGSQDGIKELIGKSGLPEAKNQISTWIEKNFREKPDFISWEEGKINFRNQVMALHTWQTIAHSVTVQDDKTPKQLVFYAGNQHISAKDEFLKGPEILTNNIRVYAEKLVTLTAELAGLVVFSASTDNGQYTTSRAARSLALYGKMFSEPTAIGGNNIFFMKDFLAENQPKSARLILFETINARQAAISAMEYPTAELKAENDVLEKMKLYLTADLAGELLNLNKIQTELISAEPAVEIELDIKQYVLPLVGQIETDSEFEAFVYYREIIDLLKGFSVTGVVNFDGKTYPVLKEADKEFILLPGNGRVIIV